MAKNVLAAKLEFLGTRTDISPAHLVAVSDSSNLVPKLVVDTADNDAIDGNMDDGTDDGDVDDSADMDDGADVDDGTDDDSMNIDSTNHDLMNADTNRDHSYIHVDAAYLSNGITAILPCTVQYMDLTPLQLEHPIRVPHVMLLRNEWSNMVDIFNQREKGIQGGAVFTGQPGIGEHYCTS